MGFSFRLAAVKGLRKKKKKEEEVRSKAEELFEGPRKRRKATVDSESCGFDKIPDELLMEILARARLPAKHVTRLMCVSKLWYSLISSRFFSKLFLEYPPPPAKRRRPRLLVSLVQVEDPRKYYFLSTSWTPDVNLDTPVYILDQVLDTPGLEGFFVNALRGLICVTLGRSVRICNLTTDQIVTLPIIRPTILAEPIDDNIFVCFVHDPVHDEYKVLITVWELSKEKDRVVRSEHQVLVLGPGASWRNTRSRRIYPHCPCTHRVTINGVLYYGALIDKNTSLVVSFDLASEDFNLIELPFEAGIMWDTTRAIVMEYEGKLAVLDWSRLAADASVKLWVMEDAEKSKWSNKTMVLPVYNMSFNMGDDLSILGSTGPGEVRLSMTTNLIPIEPRLYVIYNLEKNKIARKIVISPLQQLWYFGLNKGTRSTVFEDGTESIMYLET